MHVFTPVAISAKKGTTLIQRRMTGWSRDILLISNSEHLS